MGSNHGSWYSLLKLLWGYGTHGTAADRSGPFRAASASLSRTVGSRADWYR